MVLSFNDNDRAAAILETSGIRLLDGTDPTELDRPAMAAAC